MTRRVRRRVEAGLVLLAFPVAIALTVVAIGVPGGAARLPGRAVTVAPAAAVRPVSVALRGGHPLSVFSLADTLAADGYDVISVVPDENAIGSETEVVYYDRNDLAAAERLRNLLGVGTIRRDQVFSPSSDLTIHIGKDLKTT